MGKPFEPAENGQGSCNQEHLLGFAELSNESDDTCMELASQLAIHDGVYLLASKPLGPSSRLHSHGTHQQVSASRYPTKPDIYMDCGFGCSPDKQTGGDFQPRGCLNSAMSETLVSSLPLVGYHLESHFSDINIRECKTQM